MILTWPWVGAGLVRGFDAVEVFYVSTPGPRSERQARRLATRDRDCGSRVAARRDVDVVLACAADQ